MSAIASEIMSLTIVYSTVYSGADQRKHQSSASLDFVRGIQRSPVNSPHKGSVTRKMQTFDVVIKCIMILTGNQAFFKPATQSPSTYPGFVASRAVDGNHNPDIFAGHCAHPTGGAGEQTWWQVDLGREYVVVSINITNRVEPLQSKCHMPLRTTQSIHHGQNSSLRKTCLNLWNRTSCCEIFVAKGVLFLLSKIVNEIFSCKILKSWPGNQLLLPYWK